MSSYWNEPLVPSMRTSSVAAPTERTLAALTEKLPPLTPESSSYSDLSSDLWTMFADGIHQIRSDQQQSQAKTTRHFTRAYLWLVVLGFLFLALSVYANYLLDNKYNGTPAPAVVRLSVTPLQVNPALCPGDTLRYAVAINVERPSVVSVDWNIRNVDTNRVEVQSDTVRMIYESPGVSRSQIEWVLPDQLPATNTRPARPWQPGQYRRLIALTGVEGSFEASVVGIDFRIREGCE